MAYMRTTYAITDLDIRVALNNGGVTIAQADSELHLRGDHLLAVFRTIETMLLEGDDETWLHFGSDSEYANNGEPF